MGPFWQPFVFEQLEGICHRCGSLHLSGSCSSPATESSSEASVFGDWMSAVRQRKLSKGPQAEGKEQVVTGVAPVSDGSRSSPPGVASDLGTTTEGWTVQSKSARRSRFRGLRADGKKGGSPGSEAASKAKIAPETVSPSKAERAGFEVTVPISVELQKSESFNSKSKNSNPFASLEVESGEASLVGSRDACPGPLKRARPVEYQAPRLIARMDKKKGKGEVSSTKSKLVQVRVKQHLNGDLGSTGMHRPKGVEGVKIQPSMALSSSSDLMTSTTLDQSPNSRSSYNLTRIEVQDAMICSEADTRSAGCHPDSDMVEVQGGIPASSSG